MGMTVKLPDDLINQLSEFDSHTEEIITKSLEAGADIAYQKAKSNLNAVIKGTGSGQLKGALGISPVKPNDDGFDIKVGFAEPRQDKRGGTTYKKKLKSGKTSEYQFTNAMVANILEYGSKKHNQSAKPFMKPAADSTKSACKAEIKRVFDEEANKYLNSKG